MLLLCFTCLFITYIFLFHGKFHKSCFRIRPFCSKHQWYFSILLRLWYFSKIEINQRSCHRILSLTLSIPIWSKGNRKLPNTYQFLLTLHSRTVTCICTAENIVRCFKHETDKMATGVFNLSVHVFINVVICNIVTTG